MLKSIKYISIAVLFFISLSSFSQSDKLKTLSNNTLGQMKSMGYKPLATWYLKSSDFPLKNEVYLHGGNDYIFIGVQESKNPSLKFSLTHIKESGNQLIGNAMLNNGLVTLMIDSKEDIARETCYLSFENHSNDDTMVIIGYKSKDNSTNDHKDNFAENHYTKAQKKNWFMLASNLINQKHADDEDARKLKLKADDVERQLKEMGYTPLVQWYLNHNNLPLINKVYMHGGNNYFFITVDESTTNQLHMEVTMIEDENNFEHVTKSKYNKGFQTVLIERLGSLRLKYQLNFLHPPRSKNNGFIVIGYKSKDNKTDDHTKNFEENHYTGAEKENWVTSVANIIDDQRYLEREGVNPDKLMRVNVENVKTKKNIWSGAISDIYSVSDNYVSYGLVLDKDSTVDEVQYVIEHMKTGKKYIVESDSPVFLEKDSVAYRKSDLERFNFITNEPLSRFSDKSFFFSSEFVKSRSFKKALKKEINKPGYYTINKTYEQFLVLSNGYYLKNVKNTNVAPQLFNANDERVQIPEILTTDIDDKSMFLNQSSNVRHEMFYSPIFGSNTNNINFYIATKKGYYDLNTVTGELKPVEFDFFPDIVGVNKKKVLKLERGYNYISGFYNATSTSIGQLFSVMFRKKGNIYSDFRSTSDMENEIDYYYKKNRYFKMYEINRKKYSNVLSPSHLKVKFIGHNSDGEFELFRFD